MMAPQKNTTVSGLLCIFHVSNAYATNTRENEFNLFSNESKVIQMQSIDPE